MYFVDCIEGFRVHAWLMHFVDCNEGNAKPGAKFWGVIADSYKNTTNLHLQRTLKNLKDHCCSCNKHVSFFNQIYNQETSSRQSGTDDVMILETVKLRYKNRTGAEFKCLHW
jgi:hypothetical protein